MDSFRKLGTNQASLCIPNLMSFSNRSERFFLWLACFFVSILFLLECSLYGQAIYSLDDCIRIALENKPDVKIARLRVQSSIAERRGSLSNILPRVSYSLGYLNQGSYIDPIFDMPTSEKEFHSAGISLSQNIFDGGQWWNQIASANSAYRYSRELEMETRVTIVLNVKQAFYQYLKDLQLLDVTEQSVELAKQQLELVRHQYEVEAVARTDLLKQQVQLGNMEVEFLNQQAVTRNSFNQLANAMGLGVGADFSVVDSPGPISPPVKSFDVLLEKAKRDNPTLMTQQTQITNSELGLKIARANYFPSLSLSMGYDGSSTMLDELYSDDKRWRLQTRLSISYPLFTGFLQSTQVEVAKVDYKIEQENYQNLLRDLEVELDFTVEQLVNLGKMIPIFEETKKSAEEDLRLAQERYNLGAATILDVLDSQLSVTSANSSLVRAIYDEKILRAQLDALLGEL